MIIVKFERELLNYMDVLRCTDEVTDELTQSELTYIHLLQNVHTLANQLGYLSVCL